MGLEVSRRTSPLTAFRVEGQRFAGPPQPDPEPGHRAGAAGGVPALCLLCHRGEAAGKAVSAGQPLRGDSPGAACDGHVSPGPSRWGILSFLAPTSSSSTRRSTGSAPTTGSVGLWGAWCVWGRVCSPKPPLWSLPPSRMIQNSFVDMENMFELFHEEQEVGGPLLSPLPGMTPHPCPGAEAASPSIR